ncbi:MAG: hypothetical protein ACYTE3_31580 [Planctomycetota bacterium]|jgi:hypothetical protein
MLSDKTKTSRRQFLARGISVAAGAVATTALTSCDSLQIAGMGKPTGKTRFGFTTYQWGKDWDISTLIANCTKAQVYGVELRTSSAYAHGVELELDTRQRAEVKRRFADSPVTVVGDRERQSLCPAEPGHWRKRRESLSQQFP